MKYVLFVLATLFFTGTVVADHHANVESTAISTVVSFSTTDPASAVAAMTEFAASDCRKNAPATMRLTADNWNGTETNSHSLLMSFADAKAMLQTYGAFQQCEAWQKLIASAAANSKPHSQYLMRSLLAEGDSSKDAMYTIWQMRVTDEAAYLRAFGKLMKAQTASGAVTGAYGVWRVVGGADAEITHVSYVGAPNPVDMLGGSLRPNDDVMEFYKTVSDSRSITRQIVNSVVADF